MQLSPVPAVCLGLGFTPCTPSMDNGIVSLPIPLRSASASVLPPPDASADPCRSRFLTAIAAVETRILTGHFDAGRLNAIV
jgi:hypothetical protein